MGGFVHWMSTPKSPACTQNSRSYKMWVCWPAFQVLQCWVCIRVWAEKESWWHFEGRFFFFFFFFWLAFLGCVGWNALLLFSLPTLAVAGALLQRTSSLCMCLGCLCVVKMHRRKATLWTQGGTKWQRMGSKFLPHCVQQANGSHVFLHLRRSKQGPHSPSNTDIHWNPSPEAISILLNFISNGHLIFCSQSPQSSHTHTQQYTHYCQEKVPGEAPKRSLS